MNVGLHSLRTGGAITVANSDLQDRNWKRHERWKSDKSKDGYVVDSLDSRLEVSKNRIVSSAFVLSLLVRQIYEGYSKSSVMHLILRNEPCLSIFGLF